MPSTSETILLKCLMRPVLVFIHLQVLLLYLLLLVPFIVCYGHNLASGEGV